MNRLNIILVITSVMCFFLVFKTSDEPLIISGEFFELAFRQFTLGNTILFNLCSGLLISIWFYFLVVFIPEAKRKNRIKKHFIMQYHQFRKQVVICILSACGESGDADLINSLIIPSKFKTYFDGKDKTDQNRWYVFMNNADEVIVKNILAEFIAFKEMISYLLNNIDIEDEELHTFLHNFNTITTILVNTRADDYDSMKGFSRYLRPIFAGYSWKTGSYDYDRFGNMFDRI
ncbi:hypothetical protein [Photobacterium phosphoreum]|uniref:hypothetical protein n=1 Tax=Photobacterium phosphoreum TaxID=659 RepID=UPI00080017FC|nr:hypothetical protein [Photobacterium phosphoreum]OBU39885.1 hypothetical protein AYY25_03530 [Photobacterium phosphoreum]